MKKFYHVFVSIFFLIFIISTMLFGCDSKKNDVEEVSGNISQHVAKTDTESTTDEIIEYSPTFEFFQYIRPNAILRSSIWSDIDEDGRGDLIILYQYADSDDIKAELENRIMFLTTSELGVSELCFAVDDDETENHYCFPDDISMIACEKGVTFSMYEYTKDDYTYFKITYFIADDGIRTVKTETSEEPFDTKPQ